VPTNMSFTLSAALQQQLQSATLSPNPYIFALEYAGGQFVPGGVYTIASPGNIPTGAVSVPLPSPFSSGQVFVIVAPNGNASLGNTISTTNSGNVNAITPANALAAGYQYQLLEATITPGSADVGDVSSVNTFAFPTSFSNVNGTRGFAPGITGSQITAALNTIAPGSVLSNGLAVAPAQGSSLAANPWPTTDWTAYVNSLTSGSAAATATLNDMTIVSGFSGSSLQATPMLSQYGVQYSGGYFVLVPNTTNGANNTDWIRITTANLLNSIYAQNGSIEISTDGGNTWTTSTTTTPNTADGAVVKYFVAGFDAGYWGGGGTSPNPYDSSVIDLNKSTSWNYNYAYNATFNPAGSAVKYTNVLGTGPGTANGQNRFYDPWAQQLQNISNTYGWSYGDLISQGGTNPQLSLWSSGQEVSTINVQLFSNSETLTSATGFVGVPPSYVAPTKPNLPSGLPGYTPANVASTSNNIAFQVGFNTAATAWSPNSTTPLTFKFYAPGDGMADASTGFVSLPITSVTGSDWGTFFVNGGPGAWTITASGAPPAGQFNLNNLPVTADGTTAWYQIVFGATGSETVYNIYAASNGSGAFLPIFGAGSNPNNFVVDHGLGYGVGNGVSQATGQPAGQTNYAVNFAPSGVVTYNINTFSAPSTMYGTRGNDILTGTPGSDTINGAPGNDTITGSAGADTAVSWENARNFALKVGAAGATITIQDKVGTDGTDTLTSIEKMQFRDMTLDTASVTKTASMAADQILKVVDLYTAGLNRAPDAVGFHYWAARLADGANIGDIAKAFFGSPEAAPIYSATNSTPVFVNLAYSTALGKAPDAATAAFWINELNTGHIQRSDFVTSLIAGVRSSSGSAADALYIANKESVGAHFALTQGLNNADWARTVESAVDGTAATVTAANAQTDAFAVVAAAPATSELVVQITGIVP
jgi:hypothetical protein